MDFHCFGLNYYERDRERVLGLEGWRRLLRAPWRGRGIAELTSPERPVLFGHFDEVDDNIVAANTCCAETFGDPRVQRLLDVHGPAGVEEDLNEHDRRTPVESHVVGAVDQVGGANLVNHLEAVVFRRIGDVDEGAVDSVPDLRALILRGGALGKSHINERHDGFLSMDGDWWSCHISKTHPRAALPEDRAEVVGADTLD